MEITSVQNQYIKQLCKLKMKKYRESERMFIVEGEHLVDEALKADIVETLILRKNSAYVTTFDNVLYVSDEVMKKLSTTVSLIDVAAVCRYLPADRILGDRIVLLDMVQDPGNVGTIIRTAASFGFQDIALSEDCADLYNEKLIRSSQGAIFQTHVFQADLIELVETLKKNGYAVFGTALKNAEPLGNFKICNKIALVFGNEGQGVRQNLLAECERNLFIEIKDFESLNVAVAAGICLYHFRSTD